MKKTLLRYIFITLVTFCCARAATAGNVPDFEKIRIETTDPDSEYYYPKLLKLYFAADTTKMSDTDYEYLYYGFLFQEDYDPYRHTQFPEYKEIEHLYHRDKHRREECKRLISYAQKVLQDNPFDLVQINYLVAAYEQTGKVNLANIWRSKLVHLLKVIANSGSGLNQENAWYVVLPKHEYDFLNLRGIEAIGQAYEPPYYDLINVHQNYSTAPKQYYFNLLPILEQYYRKHPSEL